jgi:hypothetical protein
MTSIPAVGVPFLTKVIAVSPSRCSLRNLCLMVAFWTACPHTAEPYVSMGRMTPSYSHRVYWGFRLHVRPRRSRSIIRALLQAAIFWLMWGFQLSLQSIVTPSILVYVTLGTSCWYILSTCSFDLSTFFLVNRIAFVFFGQNDSPCSVAHAAARFSASCMLLYIVCVYV